MVYEGIFEGAAEGICSGYDFEAAGGVLRHRRGDLVNRRRVGVFVRRDGGV